MLKHTRKPYFDFGKSPTKIGWIYTWRKKHKGKIYSYSKIILDIDRKQMKMSLRDWVTLTKALANLEINKMIGTESAGF